MGSFYELGDFGLPISSWRYLEPKSNFAQGCNSRCSIDLQYFKCEKSCASLSKIQKIIIFGIFRPLKPRIFTKVHRSNTKFCTQIQFVMIYRLIIFKMRLKSCINTIYQENVNFDKFSLSLRIFSVCICHKAPRDEINVLRACNSWCSIDL